MNFISPGLYHVYNRGNNQKKIFFSDKNYTYFLKKCHQYLKHHSDILAWCLMPNHFHFLLEITEKSLKPIQSGCVLIPAISNGFRLLQSSYAKGINVQMKRSGSLFQQSTRSRLVDGYAFTAFHYIHQNPVTAGIVKSPEEWEYSSFKDYIGLRNGALCNRQKVIELLRLTELDLQRQTMNPIAEEKVKALYL